MFTNTLVLIGNIQIKEIVQKIYYFYINITVQITLKYLSRWTLSKQFLNVTKLIFEVLQQKIPIYNYEV